MHPMTDWMLPRHYILADFQIQSLPPAPLRSLIGCSRPLGPCLRRILPSSYLFSGISGTGGIFGFMILGCSRFGPLLPRQLSSMKISLLLMII
ncbi:hypothetical protein V6N11_058752 [Hibiscus sabdariffa]|uniref:Uncharacterized protein n=1 Tax=Hibiscus sabdariffa TaxID=183260 RepID=A0ABR2U545_9ROSI